MHLNAKLAAVPSLRTDGLGIQECPELHPSWLLKSVNEQQSNGGGFHYFSREGAVCILGDKNPSFSGGYAKLVPTLEVDIIVPPGQQAPSDPEPVAHCDQYCEGPLPASGQCSFTAYNPSGTCDEVYDPMGDPSECRLPCKQGRCQETVDGNGQERCACLPG